MAKIKDLSLADALQSLKKELLEADARARVDGTGVLQFKECEVTLALEFAPGLEAGFNLGFFQVKAAGGSKGTHSLTVRYVRPDGALPLIASVGAVGAPAKIAPVRSNKRKTKQR
jgi:hypothetical protein